MFQSTPPHGGRPRESNMTGAPKGFQSTPPHGGRQIHIMSNIRTYRFQSTPPHGGRPKCRLRLPQPRIVSIHAPAWGATKLTPKQALFIQVSIHAPAWGATSDDSIIILSGACFNPRPRMGGDLLWREKRKAICGFNPRPRMGGDISSVQIDPYSVLVSIHAPAWGAT